VPSNIEIKARVAGLATLEGRVAALSDTPREVLLQEDVFFAAPAGRLKLRRFAEGTGELIHYHRSDTPGLRESSYRIAPTGDPAALRGILAAVLGEEGVVRKERRLYRVGQTRVHLDRVEGLGDFVELEVVLRPGQAPEEGARIGRELMARLGIEPGQVVAEAYHDLLRAAEAAP
jgi:adenylate cyclase class IV